MQKHIELVHISRSIELCRDEKDNFILDLAVDGKASHIITGDKDLLVLNPFRQIKIITIADYLNDLN